MTKLKFIPFFIIISVLSFYSCTKHSEETLWNNAKLKVDEASKLREQGNQEEYKKLCYEALEILKQYLTDYPSSEKIPEVYHSIAVIYMDFLMDFDNAVKYFNELTRRYPESKFTRYAMFMTAFIYDEMLKDKNKAIDAYQKFVDKYPEDKPGEQMSFHSREILKMLKENRPLEDVIKTPQPNKDTTKKTFKSPGDKNINQDTIKSKVTN